MKKVGMLLFFLCGTIHAFGQVRVYVFVKTGPDGFVDSSRPQDSANDLRELISKRKGMILANSADDADLTLEVVHSGPVAVGTESDTTVHRGVFGGVVADTKTEAKTLPNITAELRVRGSDYSKTLAITNQRFWKDLAKGIVDQVENWVKLNQNQLHQVR